MQGFVCNICGEYHSSLPFAYGADAPYDWDAIEHQNEEFCELTQDTCVINDRYYYIKGCIEIPIHGQEDTFCWGVWVSLKRENFLRQLEYWDIDGRENILEPMFGWLSTIIPGCESTHQLKTMVHTRKVGITPYIELEPTAHILSIEQQSGMSMERVEEIAAIILHS